MNARKSSMLLYLIGKINPKASQKEIGGYLLLLSEATSHEEAGKKLQSVGNSLIR